MATIPASDNVFPILRMAEVAAPATPPTGEAHLYVKSDGLLYWKDDAGTEYPVDSGAAAGISAHTGDTTDAHDASAISIVDTGAYFTGTDVEAALQELGAGGGGGGGGGADDPVADIFGTPTTAYEFDTTSTTGLTQWPGTTPDVIDLHTIIPSHLYVKDNASGSARCGYYVSLPAAPSTIITKISDAHIVSDYHQVGLAIADSTPSQMNYIQHSRNQRFLETESGTPTGFTAAIANMLSNIQTPLYFAIVVNSATDVDFLWSYGGRIWCYLTEARNPGFTPSKGGVFLASNNTNGAAAAFDYIRLWDSAKTFPGVY